MGRSKHRTNQRRALLGHLDWAFPHPARVVPALAAAPGGVPVSGLRCSRCLVTNSTPLLWTSGSFVSTRQPAYFLAIPPNLVLSGRKRAGRAGPRTWSRRINGTNRDLAGALLPPGAASSLREGLAETLTITRLGVPPTLARTLRSTNSIESMIAICRDHAANVKRWRDGQMVLRWVAAGMGEAAKQFRRVNGYLHLAALRVALDASVKPDHHNTEEDAA